MIRATGIGLGSKEFCERFVGNLRKIVPFDDGRINLFERDGKRQRSIPFVGITNQTRQAPDPKSDAKKFSYPFEKADKESFESIDGRLSSKASPSGRTLHSTMKVPLSFANQTFGQFEIRSHQKGMYGEEEQRIIKDLCDILAHVIWHQHIARLEKSARHEIEQRDKVRAQFLAVLAHELRTSLTPVLSSAKILSTDFQEEASSFRCRLINNIVTGAETLETRLLDMLDLAQYEAGAFTLQLDSIDIKALVDELTTYFRQLVESKGQSLVIELPEELPLIKADKRRLGQVIMNLLSNAVKFAHEGGKIKISAQTSGGSLMMQVKDDGPGLSVQEQRNLFKPYWRRKVDRERSPGTGLGLSICKQLIEKHGGRIWVESRPNEGSTFTFTIPLK